MTYTPLLSSHDFALLREYFNENFRLRSSLNVASKDSAFNVWDDDSDGVPLDVYLCNATGGAFAATLPSAGTADPTGGRTVTIKKVDASGNAVTVTPNDPGETIDGATTYALSSQYDSVTLVCDGLVWHVIAGV